MTIDPVPGLRDELVAALADLDPEIGGLQNLMNSPISVEAKEAVESGLGDRSRRRDIIRSLIQAMDKVVSLVAMLRSDGYPALPDIHADPAIIKEIQDNLNNSVSAAGLFGAIASTVQDQETIDQIDADMKAAQASREAAIQP